MDDVDPQQDFLQALDYDVWSILRRKRRAEVTYAGAVPKLDDAGLTFPSPDRREPNKVKQLETCVLYVDVRDSSRLSAAQRPQRLARVYAAFVYAMISCARQAGGHVRNVIGDRVMMVFDPLDCFERAFEAAWLCNTAAQQLLNPCVKDFSFRCGIGVDFGTMLVLKAGVPRQGAEAEFYRSLVWLGQPANAASKLTDVAGKWVAPDGTAVYPPVLITGAVLEGLQDRYDDDDHPACTGWSRQPSVPGVEDVVYGGDPLAAF